MKYLHKPTVIDAIQYDGYNVGDVFQFVGKPPAENVSAKDGEYMPSKAKNRYHTLNIPTLEGVMKAKIGDFVIRGVKGEIYSCRQEIFEMNYEAVE